MVSQQHDRGPGPRRKTASRGRPEPRQAISRHGPSAVSYPGGQHITGGATSDAAKPPRCRHGCPDIAHQRRHITSKVAL